MTCPYIFREWARVHNISSSALADLLHLLGAVPIIPPAPGPKNQTSEAYVQSIVRLEAPKHGVWLTRNNVGAQKIVDPDTQEVRMLRFGLANESPAQNKVLKSGDLIGWRSITIQPYHVGSVFAQFVSRECKKVTWSWGEDVERETAQLAWANLVNKAGGDAKIVQGLGSFG